MFEILQVDQSQQTRAETFFHNKAHLLLNDLGRIESDYLLYSDSQLEPLIRPAHAVSVNFICPGAHDGR
jgi:hypothetical protein